MAEELEDPPKPALSSSTVQVAIIGIVTVLGAVGLDVALDDFKANKIAEGFCAFVLLLTYFGIIRARKAATHKIGKPAVTTPRAKAIYPPMRVHRPGPAPTTDAPKAHNPLTPPAPGETKRDYL